MSDKLGAYITKLMTTVLDKEADEFVRNLAWGELKRISADVESFIVKHTKDDSKEVEKTEKQLLQEETKDVKNSK